MIFDSWYQVARVVWSGLIVYAFVVVVLRVSGKRTLAKLNAFDLVVTVALGSTLSAALTSSELSWAEASAAVAVLVTGQLVVAWASVRWRLVRRIAKSAPSVLVSAGHFDHAVLRKNRVAVGEVEQAVRSAGFGGLDQVAAVVLETDGSLSVIGVDRTGNRSAMPR